jgi:hypothetical protein
MGPKVVAKRKTAHIKKTYVPGYLRKCRNGALKEEKYAR